MITAMMEQMTMATPKTMASKMMNVSKTSSMKRATNTPAMKTMKAMNLQDSLIQGVGSPVRPTTLTENWFGE